MKKLIFLRGVSGSGKSSFAEFLADTLGNAKAVAADDYFINEAGNYVFNDKEIASAHKWCKETTTNLLNGGDYQVVIVHNTSTTNFEVLTYKEIADEAGAEFVSLVVENRHGNENTHGVDADTVHSQALRLMNNVKLTPTSFAYEAVKRKEKDPSELLVVNYLKGYATLEEGLIKLKDEYNINNFRLNGKLLLKYDSFADKTPMIVRECRGLILDESDLSVISIPFDKFGNYGEAYADEINFENAQVLEKVDGSCTTLYYDQLNKKWCVQTLGQIEGEHALSNWTVTNGKTTWADLFWETFEKYTDIKTINALDKEFCYIFELCTPLNKVVVEHKENKLYFLGMRSKKTLLEALPKSTPLYYIFDKPKLYDYKDAATIRKICKELPKDDEGFVVMEVVGDMFKRVKMKSEQYIAEHYASTVVTLNSIAHIVFQNEQDEYLLAYPEYTGIVDAINKELDRMGSEIEKMFESCKGPNVTTNKEFSAEVQKIKVPNRKSPENYMRSFLFELWYGRRKSGKEALLYCTDYASRQHKVDMFLRNSEVTKMLNFHKETRSVK